MKLEESAINIPASVGVGETDLGLLSLGNLGRRSKVKPHTVAWDGVQYIVGPRVADYTAPIERLDLARLEGGDEVRALTYATLGQLLPNGAVVNVRLGLPVQVLQSREEGKRVASAIRKWMVGVHRFVLDGEERTMIIQRVAIMPQPVGGYFAWGLNSAGRWAQDKEALRVMIGVLDIGFNTLDLFSVRNGQIIQRYVLGQRLGMSVAADALRQAIARTYQVEISLQEADAYLRQTSPRLYVGGEKVDLRPLRRQALTTLTGRIRQALTQSWGNGRAFAHILIVGGGGLALRSLIQELYPHAEVVGEEGDCVLANARGLARYERRATKEKATYVLGLDPGFGGFKAVLNEIVE